MPLLGAVTQDAAEAKKKERASDELEEEAEGALVTHARMDGIRTQSKGRASAGPGRSGVAVAKMVEMVEMAFWVGLYFIASWHEVEVEVVRCLEDGGRVGIVIEIDIWECGGFERKREEEEGV